MDFLRKKALLDYNLNNNQKFIELFKRIFAIATKNKRMAPDGDTSMQKKLAEEIIRLLRSVGQTSSKSLQDAQLNRVC